MCALFQKRSLTMPEKFLFKECRKHNQEERNSRGCYFAKILCHWCNPRFREVFSVKIFMYFIKILHKMVCRSYNDGALVRECRYRIWNKLYQPYPFSSSGGSRPQGRPKKNFKDSSFKTNIHRVEDLVKSLSAAVLTTATGVANCLLGQRNLVTFRKHQRKLNQVTLPQIWKDAIIIPIFKKDRKLATNYRPISLTLRHNHNV